MSPSGIVYAQKGQRIEFSCSTQSASVVRKWSTKCNDSLPSGASVDQSGQLIIPHITTCHSGIYTCELSNPGGSVSQDVILAVDLTRRKSYLSTLNTSY